MPIDEKIFEGALKEGLGPCWDRSLRLFRNYGALSGEIFNILFTTVTYCPHKLIEVIEILEKYWERCFYQPGREPICDEQTKEMLMWLCREKLNMKNFWIKCSCGWYGGHHGPPADGHWHCYCLEPAGFCKERIEGGSGVHLPNREPCPHGEMCGFK